MKITIESVKRTADIFKNLQSSALRTQKAGLHLDPSSELLGYCQSSAAD